MGGSPQDELGVVPAMTQTSTKPNTQQVLTELAMVVTPVAKPYLALLAHVHPTLHQRRLADCENWQTAGLNSNPNNRWTKSHILSQRPSSLCGKWDAAPTPNGQHIPLGKRPVAG